MLHQASAVAIGERALLIEGPPGSGKSSLALALIDRGAVLIGDDGVSLAADGDRVLASPAPAIAGLLEVRNVGLLQYPVAERVRVALVLRLDRAAERLPDGPASVELLGCRVPLVRLWPDSPVLPLRAMAALSRFGLD